MTLTTFRSISQPEFAAIGNGPIVSRFMTANWVSGTHWMHSSVKANSFPRPLQTHGNVGQIFFGTKLSLVITSGPISPVADMKRSSYLWARIYLNGCNVMDDPFGWDLLDAAGSVFLKRGGGTVFAQAGAGRPLISVVMCIILGNVVFGLGARWSVHRSQRGLGSCYAYQARCRSAMESAGAILPKECGPTTAGASSSRVSGRHSYTSPRPFPA